MTIERIGVAALNPDITIKPELPIGTELWFMRDNKPWLALVAGYQVNVTAYNDKEKDGWYHQLFFRWLNHRKQKEYWNYSWQYTIKIDADHRAHTLDIKENGYYIYGRKCYFTKEELLKSL